MVSDGYENRRRARPQAEWVGGLALGSFRCYYYVGHANFGNEPLNVRLVRRFRWVCSRKADDKTDTKGRRRVSLKQ